MKQNASCLSLCSDTIPPTDAIFITELIKEEYLLHWMVDGLPAAQKMDSGMDYNVLGFHFGQIVNPEPTSSNKVTHH